MPLERERNPFPSASDDVDDWVNTPAFDFSCAQKAHDLARASVSYDINFSDETNSLWSSSASDSSATTVESDPHEVSKLEAYFYYAGLGPKGTWPRLIYRDSPDGFEQPTGPEAFIRMMRLVHVPNDHYFAKDKLWERVRDWVAEFLINQGISVSSVDFVRFTWLNKLEDREIESDEEEETVADEKDEESDVDDGDIDAAYASISAVKTVEYGDRYYTDPTIWIGVLPDTLNGTRAYELSRQIRAFINKLSVTKVDIAFRESITQPMVRNGPALYAPAETGDHLKEFIDNVSTALSLPICGRKTTMQGTLGPYFQHGNKLYAITARHNLFLANDGNAEYRYHPHGPKREVVVMGTPAFDNYRASIQARISNLNDTVDSLKKSIVTYTDRVARQIGLPDTQQMLTDFETELDKTNRRIAKLKKFFVTLSNKWSKLGDRVIGHVVWAPPIGVGVGPDRFTRDVCVVELYKSRFSHFVGNVLSLGPETDESDLKGLMYERIDIPSEFKYPDHGLLQLRGILTSEQIESPNTLDTDGDRIRRVLKRGSMTNTTVGTLSHFLSFVRKYFTTGTLESLELAIFPHESQVGPFSKGGDSGALVVSAIGEFVALITGGTNKGTDGSDITYATLFKYIWDLILAEFQGANLYWDDIPAFLAAAAA